MGLKYDFFLTRVKSEDLNKRLVDAGMNDDTRLMLQDMEHNEKKSQLIKDKLEGKLSGMLHGEFISELLKRPEDPALLEYQNRTFQSDIFSIWGMAFPKDARYTFGGYTVMPFQRREFTSVLVSTFKKAKLDEFALVSYHHNSNEGNIILIDNTSPEIKIKTFDPSADEVEDFQKYAARVSKETGYPIADLHNYISNLPDSVVKWTFEASLKLKKAREEKQ